jgi:hypothetical protein
MEAKVDIHEILQMMQKKKENGYRKEKQFKKCQLL